MRAQCLAHHGAHREIGHIVVVHDVEVDQVGARRLDSTDFLSQSGKVGRQDAGCDAEGA